MGRGVLTRETTISDATTQTMTKLSRRHLLKVSTALGVAGTVSRISGPARANPSPDLEKYAQPLPVPPVKRPDRRESEADYYEVTLEEFEHSFHPDLPATTLWGYDGSFPGPTIVGWQGRSVRVKFDNGDLPTDHLFEVDDRIHGTAPGDYPDFDGRVPDVRTVTHFHGLNVPPASDGQAEMWTSPDGALGPRFVREDHDLPNRQPRTSTTYHDHALGISRLNNYAGLVGAYLIRSAAEKSLGLPMGEFDVPLVLTDRSFDVDGSLQYPDSFEANVAGDTAVVNGAAWPFVTVEPRRYRFRILNPSNGRTYGIGLANESGGGVPAIHQIAAGHGFLDDVVEVGPGGDLDTLLVAPFERADVVVDFADHAGETFVLTNDAGFPFEGETGGSGLGELVQFRVTDPGQQPSDPSTPPANLDLPGDDLPDGTDAANTRQMTMGMTMDENDLHKHLLNGGEFFEPVQIRPELGSVEVWELTNDTGHTHPIHLHLVQFRVIGRGPDGTDDPLPNERGGKDVVRVDPGETVRIAVRFGDYTGQFPWHCHILEHEDHAMMRPFEVVE